MRQSHRERTVGPWAKQKLDALESYLIAYQSVMKGRSFRLVYVDAFAGAGEFRLREYASVDSQDIGASLLDDDDDEEVLDDEDLVGIEEFVKGSPVRALSLDRPFDHYRFIDLDASRAQLLQELQRDFPDLEIKAINEDANVAVQHIAKNFGAPDLRGVAFLDPYGAHLHWETLEALAKTKKFDVIINIPVHMAMNRLVRIDGKNEARDVEQMDKAFGCHDWHDVCYTVSGDLFAGERQIKVPDAPKQLLDLYVQRLRGIFSKVSQPSLVRNRRNCPLYYLIWAGENGTGLKIAEHILGLGDKVKVPRRKSV